MTFGSSSSFAPRVTVVMANYNGAAHLSAAMDAVLTQTLTDLELVVVDDASTDDSVTFITRHAAADARVRPVLLSENGGPGRARNRGLDLARGDWIAVADADDLMHPRRLERLVGFAEEHALPAVADDLIFFSDTSDGAARHLFQDAELGRPEAVSLEGLLAETFGEGANHLGYVKPVFRRASLGPLRYRTDLRIGEDFDLLLRFAARGHDLTVLPEAWYIYRRHAQSISHRLAARDAEAMLTAMEDLRAVLPLHAAALLEARVNAMRQTAEAARVFEDAKALRFAAVARGLLRNPRLARPLAKAVAQKAARTPRIAPDDWLRDIGLLAKTQDRASFPASWQVLTVGDFDQMTSGERAQVTAATMDSRTTIHASPDVPPDILGLVPDARRIYHHTIGEEPLVHVRTTAYKRPKVLRRALESLRAQTIEDWICDVYDDDPDRSGEAVVRELDDPRIRYRANVPQRMASANIDRCFTRFNPHGATYFCCLEDDNQLLPTFLEENILLSELKGVNILLRNQLVEYGSGTEDAHVGATGLLDEKFDEGICDPEILHLSLMADWGVSNGGLFWSRNAVSDLEVGVPCSAAFQEYLRTRAIVEPIYIALKPLAIWAENGEHTVRDLGARAGWFERELQLKRSTQALRRHVWASSTPARRQKFVEGALLRYPDDMRADGLAKALFFNKTSGLLPFPARLRLFLRGLAIRIVGTPVPGLRTFFESRGVSPSGRV